MAKIIDAYRIEIEEQDKQGSIIDLRKLVAVDSSYIHNYIQQQLEKEKTDQKTKITNEIKTQFEEKLFEEKNKIRTELKLEFLNEEKSEIKKLNDNIIKLELQKTELKKSIDDKIIAAESKKELEITNSKNKEIEKLQKELEQKSEKIHNLILDKKQKQPADLGIELEEFVKTELLDPEKPDKLIQTKASGADFIYNVFDKGSEITIECKNGQKWNDSWIKKLIQDASNNNSKFKILVTAASPESKFDSLEYWVEDRLENIYVVRPRFLKQFISLLKVIIKKEKEISETIKEVDNDEIRKKMSKLKEIQNNGIAHLKAELDSVAKVLDDKAKTSTNIASALSREAKKLRGKKIEDFISKIKSI